MALAVLKPTGPICVPYETQLSPGKMAWFQRGCRGRDLHVCLVRWRQVCTQVPSLALGVQWRLPHISLFGVCRRSGRLLGHAAVFELSAVQQMIPSHRSGWLDWGVAFPQEALCLLGHRKGSAHLPLFIFLWGDWFLCKRMCACVVKGNLQYLNCRFLNNTVWKHP